MISIFLRNSKMIVFFSIQSSHFSFIHLITLKQQSFKLRKYHHLIICRTFSRLFVKFENAITKYVIFNLFRLSFKPRILPIQLLSLTSRFRNKQTKTRYLFLQVLLLTLLMLLLNPYNRQSHCQRFLLPNSVLASHFLKSCLKIFPCLSSRIAIWTNGQSIIEVAMMIIS